MRLDGDRIFLRPFGRRDASQLLDVRLREREFLDPWEPVRDEAFYTLAGQRTTIDRLAAEARAGAGAAFGVFEPNGGDLVGFVHLSGVARGPAQTAFLGYWIVESRNGRGYATEAVRLAVGHGFGELRLHRIQAGVMPRNAGSLRVLEKAGFRREGIALRYLQIAGVWEDHVILAVTSEEWPRAS